MFTAKRLAIAASLALLASAAVAADKPGLGKPVSEADLALWDISVGPDGKGLPPGSGTAGEEDHRHVGRLAQATQRLHAIHARHLDIQDGEIWWARFEAVERGETIRVGHNPIALGLKR